MSTPTALRPALRKLLKSSRGQQTPPSFLLPSLLAPSTQTSPFSCSPNASYPRDMNRERGVSTVRRTGPRKPLSASRLPLPKPVLDPSKRSKPTTDPDHGLWEFFHSKEKPMNTPEEDDEHGRAWCVEELRGKSWEDLHALWWVCPKERNRIATEAYERKRLDAGYGDFESKRRDVTVRLTQRAVKQVLTERFYSWRDAQEVAKDDPEVTLSGDGPAYVPSDYVDEDIMEEEQYEAVEADAAEGQLEQQIQPELTPESKPEARPNP